MKRDLVSAMKEIDAIFEGGEAWGLIPHRETAVKVKYLDAATTRKVVEALAERWGVTLKGSKLIDPEFGEQLSLLQQVGAEV